MIKGVNKYVIEVLDTGNMYYDRALLFVKPEYTNIDRTILEKEAKKVLRNMDTVSFVKHSKKVVFGILYFAVSVLIGILIATIFINIFSA